MVDDNRDGVTPWVAQKNSATWRVTHGGRILDGDRPDLMLVDLVMPDMDGCGLVERSPDSPPRSNDNRGLTGHADEEHKPRP